MTLATNLNPRGAELLRALTHSLYVEETHMSLTITPPTVARNHVPLPHSGERLGEGVAGDGASHPHLTSPSSEGEEHEQPRPRMPHSLFAADETTLTPAGEAWLAAQPLPADHPASIRARMAREIDRAFTAAGCVTRDDLARMGFSPPEIETHFAAAIDAAGVKEAE